jgi:hypothetical protein
MVIIASEEAKVVYIVMQRGICSETGIGAAKHVYPREAACLQIPLGLLNYILHKLCQLPARNQHITNLILGFITNCYTFEQWFPPVCANL